MAKSTVTYRGPLMTGKTSLMFRQALINSVERINKVVLSAAKDELAAKKISEPKQGGPLFNSIAWDIIPIKITEVKGKVFTDVPYAIYVEEDRKLRNGVSWSAVNPNAPYKFMAKGAKVGNEKAAGIVNQELSKII